MKNMLLNYDFGIPFNGQPMYYITEGGITYDEGTRFPSRTLSLSISDGAASVSYEPFIDIAGAGTITVGFFIRAIEADLAAAEITFYDAKFCPLARKEINFAHYIGFSFTKVSNNFIPWQNSAYCTVKIKFAGKITALTLYKPYFIKSRA